MPLTISRPVSVYRLWLEDDLTQLFEDHAAVGWICTKVCAKTAGVVVWSVALELQGSRNDPLSATLADVVVSDLVTVQVQTVAEYNADHPDDQISEGS